MGVRETEIWERQKERVSTIRAEQYRLGRDIAPLPRVQHPRRKSSARLNFRKFCKSYFPDVFTLGFSPDHLTIIGQIEQSVLHGGLFATAAPRGSGKTSLAEVACLWAILYGHRDFVVLIGSDEGRAGEMLESIKTHCEVNALLLEDFPEAVYPIVRLEGISHRANGQMFDGERTRIGWTANELIMPTIPGSKASGAVVRVTGITGGIRGMKFTRQDGSTVRPSIVVVDDPQTDASARSPAQCEARERILAGAILGLAGPGKKISGIMPCTVITPGDVADNILNREKHPEWNGTRTKMVYEFPSNTKLWDEYAEILKTSLRAGNAGKEATEFYRKNRAAMDEGAKVAWEERYNPDEISALQHAMGLKIRDERAFHAEYQNEPLPDDEIRPDDLTADQIAAKLNRLGRGEVPTPANRLTAFIDVQASLLYYVVCGWEDDFTGHVIDYGSYPDQHLGYYTLRDARNTLARVSATTGLEGQIYAGLEALGERILAKEWARDDGANLKVERCLIDANWADSTATVYRFCRQSAHASILSPSRGKYIGASSTPMREWAKKPGEKVGLNWKIGIEQDRKAVRRVLYDTNFWKSFCHQRFSTAMGDRGCLSLFGDNPGVHRMFADHVTSEFRVSTQGRGRKCDEWKHRPERPDNHLFDCMVGCAVAASIQGVSLIETTQPPPPTKKRISFADLRARQGRPRT